jgi:hypothetical protein
MPHPIPVAPGQLDELLRETAELVLAIDATNGETLRNTVSLVVSVATGLNHRRIAGDLRRPGDLTVAERDHLLRGLLAESWGDLETAQAIVGDLLSIELDVDEAVSA